MSIVQIKARSNGRQPLVSLLEACLDFENVVVIRQEFAVKSFIPLELLVTVPTGYLLTKFILEPLIGPWAEKWKEAVNHRQNSLQSFNLVLNIANENLIIEAPIGTNHEYTAEIWCIIGKTLEILSKTDYLAKISKIKIELDATDKLSIVRFEQEQSKLRINLGEQATEAIPSKQVVSTSPANPTVEQWVRQQTERADTYAAIFRQADQ